MFDLIVQRPLRSSTIAAAVSSQDVSIPSTSMGETLDERRLEDTALRDDRGDVLVRRDVERGIAHLRALGCELVVADVRHLARITLLDRNAIAIPGRKIDR